MSDIILLKQGEIVLKGLNRRSFEMKLMGNVRRRLKPFGSFRVYTVQSTVYVEPQDENCDMDGAFEAVKTIFGIASVSRAAACEKDKDAIFETAKEYLRDEMLAARSFKVESKRSDKRFPMTSIQLSQYVGGLLAEEFPHIKVDVHNPELVVNLEVRDYAAYVHGPNIEGAGGMPVGANGRVVSLLSGGIDSPVSTYLAAKRGVQIIPVHFFSFPYTSQQAKEKVLELAQILTKYCGRLMVEIVPFTHIQEEIRDKCPEEYFTVIMPGS
jgi:thiamine biosynthesis protein ThiI